MATIGVKGLNVIKGVKSALGMPNLIYLHLQQNTIYLQKTTSFATPFPLKCTFFNLKRGVPVNSWGSKGGALVAYGLQGAQKCIP